MAELPESGQTGAQIEVTPAMVEAGVEEIREHHVGDDLGYVVESVFRAMAYLSPSASFTIPAR